MAHSIELFTILALVLGSNLVLSSKVELTESQLYITVTEDKDDEIQRQNYKTSIFSKIKNQKLTLTQSSRITIHADLEFSLQDFKPEFISFRLRHPEHENLTEPVLAVFNSVQERFDVIIDLGNPTHIKPYSGNYQLQAIVSDDKLDSNIRNVIADCNVTFRKSWSTLPASDLSYQTEQLIETSAPAVRQDPPNIFTLFVIVLIGAAGFGFLAGMSQLKVNFKYFPSSSMGFIMNVALVTILSVNLFVLLMFWVEWTFLETLNYLLLLLLPTALIANYALTHVKKN